MESRSLVAVRQVLAWASEQGMSIRGLLGAEQLAALSRAFSGAEPWSFALYEPLRAFSQAAPRLNLPDMPQAMHFGDALSALEELLAARGTVWPTQPAVAPRTLEELGYPAASAGMARLRDAHSATWREHAADHREFVLRGAERASGKTALVIGAGRLDDIPLRQLAERFQRLLLVHIDAAALTDGVEQARLPPELRARLAPAVADVTGIADIFVHRAREALLLADENACYQALLGLLHGYCLAQPPRLAPDEALPEGRVDFACSSLVLSQLATPFNEYLERGFNERFPDSELMQAHEFRLALAQFTHRIQQAHVAALLALAPCVALSSATAGQFTQRDAHGNLSASQPFALIGAPHLEDLVPAQLAHVVTSSEWSWQRVVPTPQSPQGQLLQVVGIVAERIS